ncbi:MAG: L-aspartate oxidase [Campylobacterota bacterium]|nr:L-aspartate oxidase [Campylobacterota bacterium]
MHYDVIIVGAGIAGLYASATIPKSKKVLIINKAQPWECNTFYAQGGVSVAYNDADIPLHISDTLSAGDGLCDKEAVHILSQESQSVIADLIKRGFSFDSDPDGNLYYTQEAAHSRQRILRAGGDATGRYLHHFLLNKMSHPMLAGATVTDLLIDDAQVCGVEVYYRDGFKQIYADNVIIASGGVGSLFQFHTNAASISGELHGICIEKGLELERMEMTQFHPTVYVGSHSARKQLLTEALRGEGAHVEDEDGFRFLFDYDKRGELAPRDIVSRAIFDYSKKREKQVYLSFKSFETDHFHERFPNISLNLKALGYNVPRERVPISPAFHYSIGGIKTNLDGEVEGISGLYAIGEVASTRVHGANRLASNSLLEGLVFASRAVEKLLKNKTLGCKKVFQISKEALVLPSDKAKKDALRRIMWHNVSIVRTEKGLQEAKEFVDTMLKENLGRMLKLRLLTAKSIVDSALERRESVGVHTIIREKEC